MVRQLKKTENLTRKAYKQSVTHQNLFKNARWIYVCLAFLSIKILLNFIFRNIMYTITINIDDNELDIEIVTPNDKDYKYILAGREERKKNPENYVDMDSINWD